MPCQNTRCRLLHAGESRSKTMSDLTSQLVDRGNMDTMTADILDWWTESMVGMLMVTCSNTCLAIL